MADKPTTRRSGRQERRSVPTNDTPDAAGASSEDRLEDLPGRPIGPDEVDPELISLPRTHARIGPLLSLSVVIFCVYIMVELRGDLTFSRQGDTPRTLATMTEATDARNTDHFVELRGAPDRAFAVRVSRSKADPGSRMAPVQGSNGKLWLLLPGNVWVAGLRYDEIYRGRLRELSALPFAGDLRRHVKSRGPEPRFATARAAREALASKASTVTTPAGDEIAIAPDTAVRVIEEKASEIHVRTFATEALKSAEDWTAALTEVGLAEVTERPDNRTLRKEGTPERPQDRSARKDAWLFSASVPGGVDAARRILREKGVFAAIVDPIKDVHQATWRELAQEGDSLVIGTTRLAWPDVSWLAFEVTRDVRDDAVVLVTDEQPETYWYMLPLFGLLGLSGLLFAWAFVRTVRSMREPGAIPGDDSAPR